MGRDFTSYLQITFYCAWDMQNLPINMEILGHAVYVLERYKLDFSYLLYILNTTHSTI